MQLVYYTRNQSEPYTLSTVISKYAEVEHRAVRQLIDKYKEDLEEYEVLTFEMHKPPKGSLGGRPRKVYLLNEQQATLIITYLDNTNPVREFKKALVKAFYDQRKIIYELKISRAIEKPKRKELTDAIKNYKYLNNWSYKQFTDLLLKLTTGKNAKQLKELNNADCSSLDLLTIEQHKQYYELENKLIVLIEMNFTYKEIKEMLTERVVQTC